MADENIQLYHSWSVLRYLRNWCFIDLQPIDDTENLLSHLSLSVIAQYHEVSELAETTGRKMYVDPSIYASADEAVRDFASWEIQPKFLSLKEEIGRGKQCSSCNNFCIFMFIVDKGGVAHYILCTLQCTPSRPFIT